MKEQFVAIERMTVVGDAAPTDAESLAIGRFVREVKRITGVALPIAYGVSTRQPCVRVGNRGTLDDAITRGGYPIPKNCDGEDIARQSYVVDVVADSRGRRPVILAAGLGIERTAKGHLGAGYALGELLRRLDVRNGRWGFALPGGPIVASPATPHRTLYVMNSGLKNPGLSLEYFSDEQIDDYVDRLVEARYSRIGFFQWCEFYLYPGNAPRFRADSLKTHQTMRRVFDRARRRGLEVYHQLTPAHANVDLLPDDPGLIATGYYGRTSVCWSRPEARDLARKMAQAEMEYYGPMDGYMVWFYDPGGCFCQECAAHQAERIFDQFITVVDAAKTISPEAKFQAGLWPTWAFAKDKERIGYPGKGYTEDDVRKIVHDFLRMCRERFGARELTIIDSCEGDDSNIYNGYVDPKEFKRSGFTYTVLGMASEQSYPFAHFRLRYLSEQLGKARERGLEEAQLFIQYSATNYPGVYAFADALYEAGASWQETASRFAAAIAKGDARKPFAEYLTAMEDLVDAADADAVDGALRRAESAAIRLERSPHFFGDRQWLLGHLKAQRHYFELARAADDAAFAERLAMFKADMVAIPMYRDYAERAIGPDMIKGHIKAHWQAALPKAP